MAPVSNVNRGVPETVTASEKLTFTAITTPALYEPFAVDDVTEVTVGAASARAGKQKIARINVESDLRR